MDKEGPDLSHRTDRDSRFLAAPSVALPEEHVGHTVVTGFYDQPLDLPYLSVGRTGGQVAAYVYLARRDGVDGDLLRDSRLASAAPTAHPRGQGHQVPLSRGGVWVRVPGGVEIRHDLGLLGGWERLE